MPLVRTQPIVDIEDVVVIFVIETFVVGRLAGFGEDPSRVVRGFVSELRIANMIRLEDVGRELPERLCVCARNRISEGTTKKKEKKRWLTER